MVLKILAQRRISDAFHAFAAGSTPPMNAQILSAMRSLSNPLLDANALVRSAQAVIAIVPRASNSPCSMSMAC